MVYNNLYYGLLEVTALNCMKCGIELKNSGVFCDDCLTDMKKYPVKPNITVQIPYRPSSSQTKKKPRRYKYVKPEEQIRHLKRVRNRLIVVLMLVILLLALCVAALVWLALSGMLNELARNFGIIS